jgi:hypothetical protein
VKNLNLVGQIMSAMERYKNFENPLKTSRPIWQPGQRLRVLLWSEQGLGDEVMFAPLISELHGVSAKLIVQCDPRLIPLFKRYFPIDIAFHARHETIPEEQYDVHLPMGSMPLHFGKLRQALTGFRTVG